MRFDDRVTGRLAAFAPHAKVIHVDIDPAEVGKIRTPDVPIVGDVKRVLAKLLKLMQETPAEPNPQRSAARRAWWQQIRAWKDEHPYDTSTSDSEIKPQHLMAEIDRLSGGEAIITSDVGQHQMWAAQLCRFNEPRLWINSGGLGSMGFGLPAAVGAQMARPDKLVFSISGDGGFQMSLPELATIASNGLPIKIIVMNNGHLGMVRQWQTLFYNNRLSGVELDAFPDAEKLAAAYGFKGRTIDKPWELAAALEEAVKEPGPYLLNVKVTPFECVYPMVPAGGAINEMVLGPPQPVAVPVGPAFRPSTSLRISYAADNLITARKQTRRADARHRTAHPARLQHREPHRRPYPGPGALPHDHRGGRGLAPARPGHQADEQAHQRAAGQRP